MVGRKLQPHAAAQYSSHQGCSRERGEPGADEEVGGEEHRDPSGLERHDQIDRHAAQYDHVSKQQRWRQSPEDAPGPHRLILASPVPAADQIDQAAPPPLQPLGGVRHVGPQRVVHEDEAAEVEKQQKDPASGEQARRVEPRYADRVAFEVHRVLDPGEELVPAEVENEEHQVRHREEGTETLGDPM